jgi:hypothetical protein
MINMKSRKIRLSTKDTKNILDSLINELDSFT